MSSPHPGQIFQTAVIQMDDSLLDAVQEIEHRHKGILSIEQGVREIQELFNDLACLVDLQQETLDVIERNIMDTSKYSKDAEKKVVGFKNSTKTPLFLYLVARSMAIWTG